MALSNDIISQFVKITNDKTEEKKETIVYGTVVVSNSTKYVKIDGSNLLTPITTTADAQNGDRVTVMIKNHTATVTGNVSSPAARSADVKGMGSDYQKLSDKIDQFEIVVADKVDTDALNAVTGRIDYLVSDNTVIRQNLTATQANITDLQASNVNINKRLTAAEADITELKTDKLDVNIANITYATIDNLEATNTDVHNLEATYATFTNTTTAKLAAQDASISDLQAKKLDADTAMITYAKVADLTAATADITDLETTFADFETTTTDKLAAQDASIANLQADKVSTSDIEGKYANIDFSNIGKAAMQYLYAESGLIEDVVVGDTTITGKLVGVTISGDLIEGNTVKAEKLVIKGSDGLYYKLNTDGVTTEAEQTNQNSLNGSIIKAKTITATKIAVDDLVAFGATIGGFHITDSAIYSGVKESVDNSTSGLYMDKEGQLALGDSSDFIKYYKDQNGDYHLEIAAQSVVMATSSTSGEPQTKTIEDAIDELSETAATTANDLSNYITSMNGELESLQGQIDGSITTWFYEYEPTTANVPAKEWTTTDLKNTHLGDLFYNTLTGYCYRWQVLNNVYSWKLVKDVDITKAISDAASAQATANTKKRVFVSTPTVPYDIGDLWVQGSTGDIMKCCTAKTSSQSYNSADWIKASKYTDDTAANNAKKAADAAQTDVNAVKTRVTSAETQIAQNKEQIALRATKTEVTETLGGYYTKAQADAAIKVSADSISQNVSTTYATKTALDTTNSNVTTAQSTATQAKNAIDNLDVGGRNILLNSRLTANASKWDGASSIKEYVTKYNRSCARFNHTALKQTKYISQSVLNKLEPNTTYTMSGWVLTENIVKGTTNHTCMFYHSGSYKKDGTSTWFGYGSKSIPINTGTGTWTRLVWTFTTDNKLDTATGSSIQIHTRDLTGDIYFCDLKLEKGNRATDWTPAPEDAESGISALDTRMASAESSLTILANSIASNVTETTNLGTRASTLEQTASGLTARLDTAESNITTAQTTANTAKTNAATAQSTANTALARTTVKDTREKNETPGWYMTNYPKQTVVEFKKCTTIGLSGATYCSLETFVPWNDKSGGYPKQTATVNEKQYWRTGSSDTEWGVWMAASETATNFISFNTTDGVLIGNKTSGSWSGTRAQITGSAFNILDSSGTILSSYGATTTIGKSTGSNVYIDSDSVDIRKNGKVLATFDQYGLKIANTNDATGSLGSGTTKPALVIGTPTGYHIEMDNNEIMAKSNATTSSHLFLNMEGGNVSINNNADRAMMFQDGALYAKNSSFNNGNYLGIVDGLNDSGNTVFGYGGYVNKIGGTNIYGNSISLVSNGNVDVEASWINCRSIAPSAHATYALGVYGEKGWSNIYLGKGDGKTNALHIIAGNSTYTLCGVNSSGQYIFGNKYAVMYYQVKDVNETTTGNAFKVTSGNNTASNNTSSVWFFGAADATSRYIGSYLAYNRTYSSAANMVVTSNGVFGRSTSSSKRYKNSIVEADMSELKGLYDLPVKKFKYNTDYISSDDELYDKYLYGFIVEDLEDILPCAVEHITDENGKAIPEMWNVNVIIPSLLKLIQDLNDRVIALEKKGE